MTHPDQTPAPVVWAKVEGKGAGSYATVRPGTDAGDFDVGDPKAA